MAGPFYDPFKGAGQIVNTGPDYVTWMLDLGDQIVTCTQSIVSPILDQNQEEEANSTGQRWGDGKVVAHVPLDFYFDKIAPARVAGDTTYIRKILNDIDYRKLRSFHGKV